MYLDEQIKWEDAEIDKEYKFEEKYYFQAEVKLLNKYTDPNQEDYMTVELEVIKPYTGCHEGQIVKFSKSLKPEYTYITQNMKFLTLDSWFSYTTS